jgi:hypothetical protein
MGLGTGLACGVRYRRLVPEGDSVSKRKKAWLVRMLVVLAIALAAAAVAVGVLRAGGDDGSPAAPAGSTASGTGSVEARFALLSRADSNQCGLQPENLDTIARNGRLQGACCFPMDLEAYRHQLEGLKRYATVDVIPKDPYDIPVALAKRLIGYQAIELTPKQKALYDRATELSEVGGPCCCPCWRFAAFEGQAKYLITRRTYSAEQIAEVWDLEEGCGGPKDHPA